MRSHARLLCALAALTCVAPATTDRAFALDDAQLRSQLSTLHRQLGPHAAALVVDLQTGETLFQRRATMSLSPASNQKLFTTAAALLRFGPQSTLETRVMLDPGDSVDEDGAVQSLYLVGGGDPSLNDAALNRLAASIKGAGVTRIRGGVLADESLFDRRRGSYDSRYRPDGDIGGWLGALTWAHGRPDYQLGPAQEAANRLHKLLRLRGIAIGRRPLVRTLARADGAFAQPLASVQSPPMMKLAATTNQPSDNFYAEMLIKGLGARYGTAGSTAAGALVVRDSLAAIGVKDTKIVDGSGLSRADRATPRQIIALLRAMIRQGPEVGDAWLSSLAVIGRSGTLARRMRGTAAQDRCRGKTGTLRGVSALSGYCGSASGRLLAFSLLENAVDPGAAKSVEDRIVPRIAQVAGG